MARDDDTDYTILGMHILEQHGFGFGPTDVAEEWLLRLPFFQVYTAERAAYRNLIHGLARPRRPAIATRTGSGSARRSAPTCGATCARAIPRAPRPRLRRCVVVAHAERDLRGDVGRGVDRRVLRHDRREVGASTFRSTRTASLEARGSHPRRARPAREGARVGGGAGRGRGALRSLQLRAHGEQRRPRHGRAAVGGGDFTRTIGLAVQGGWDTDCTGATAGSIFGALHGADALPGHWVDPLNDLVRSAIMGYDRSTVSDLPTGHSDSHRPDARADNASGAVGSRLGTSLDRGAAHTHTARGPSNGDGEPVGKERTRVIRELAGGWLRRTRGRGRQLAHRGARGRRSDRGAGSPTASG